MLWKLPHNKVSVGLKFQVFYVNDDAASHLSYYAVQCVP